MGSAHRLAHLRARGGGRGRREGGRETSRKCPGNLAHQLQLDARLDVRRRPPLLCGPAGRRRGDKPWKRLVRGGGADRGEVRVASQPSQEGGEGLSRCGRESSRDAAEIWAGATVLQQPL